MASPLEHVVTPMDDEKGPIGAAAVGALEIPYIDPEEEKKLVRFQDFTIMPMVSRRWIYMCRAAEKSSVSSTSLRIHIPFPPLQ